MALLDKKIMNEQNKKDLEKVKEIIANHELNWTWESIYNVIYEQNTDWESLRVYDGKLRNIVVIIMAGLHGDKRTKEEAFKVLEEAANNKISPIRLHKFLYEILQERHFFMDTPEMEAMTNLIQADNQDQIALQNLIYSLIYNEASKETYQQLSDSTK